MHLRQQEAATLNGVTQYSAKDWNVILYGSYISWYGIVGGRFRVDTVTLLQVYTQLLVIGDKHCGARLSLAPCPCPSDTESVTYFVLLNYYITNNKTINFI